MTGSLPNDGASPELMSPNLANLAFDSLVDGILIYNADDVVVRLNEAFKHFTRAFGVEVHEGMTRRDLIGAFIDTGNWDTGDFSKEQLIDQQIAIRKDLTGNDTEEISPPNGRYYLRRMLQLDDGGEVIIITDITSVKKAERNAVRERKKAEIAAKAKTVFIANMSHELRTPLNGILGMAQVLESCGLGEREQGFVKIIQNSGTTLLEVINDLLDFSKLDAGKLELDSHRFNIRKVATDVVKLLEITAFEKNIELLLHVQSDIPDYYVGDAGRLRQIFLNLIGNAIKFTHVGYVSVSVRGRQEKDNVIFKVEISDTGIGIPEEKHADIFDPFTQVDSSISREYGGTGLGLNIVSNIIEQMGGDIALQSAKGEGTTFTISFSLPIDTAGEPDQIAEDNNFEPIPYEEFARRCG